MTNLQRYCIMAVNPIFSLRSCNLCRIPRLQNPQSWMPRLWKPANDCNARWVYAGRWCNVYVAGSVGDQPVSWVRQHDQWLRDADIWLAGMDSEDHHNSQWPTVCQLAGWCSAAAGYVQWISDCRETSKVLTACSCLLFSYFSINLILSCNYRWLSQDCNQMSGLEHLLFLLQL